MIVNIINLDIKPDCVEAFKAISVYNHQNSRKEAGNIRFDVLQNSSDPTKFVLYEVFRDQAAVDSHKQTEHYFKWRDTVADMMASPRTATSYTAAAYGGE